MACHESAVILTKNNDAIKILKTNLTTQYRLNEDIKRDYASCALESVPKIPGIVLAGDSIADKATRAPNHAIIRVYGRLPLLSAWYFGNHPVGFISALSASFLGLSPPNPLYEHEECVMTNRSNLRIFGGENAFQEAACSYHKVVQVVLRECEARHLCIGPLVDFPKAFDCRLSWQSQAVLSACSSRPKLDCTDYHVPTRQWQPADCNNTMQKMLADKQVVPPFNGFRCTCSGKNPCKWQRM